MSYDSLHDNYLVASHGDDDGTLAGSVDNELEILGQGSVLRARLSGDRS